MMKVVLFCLFISLSLINAWQTPTIVYKGGHSPSLATDFNDTTHIVFCSSTTNTLLYVSVSSTEEISEVKTIGSNTGCFYLSPQIVTYSGVYSPSLYVVYGAKREDINSESCDDSDSTGCNDVWFVESQDSGNSWSSPVLLPHPSDSIHRKYSPNVLEVNSSIAVVYTYDNNSISFVSRQDSWNSEVLIIKGEENIYYPKLDYTTQGDDITYHMVFLNNATDLVYTQTTTQNFMELNDTTWTQKIIAFSSLINQYTLIADHEDNKGVYIAYSQSGKMPCMVINSTDNGISFLTPGPINDNGDFIDIAFRSGDLIGVRGGVELIFELPNQLQWETFEVNWETGLSPSDNILNPTHAKLSSGSFLLSTVFTDSNLDSIFFNVQPKLV